MKVKFFPQFYIDKSANCNTAPLARRKEKRVTISVKKRKMCGENSYQNT